MLRIIRPEDTGKGDVGQNSHLRVKETGRGFDDADSSVVGADLVDGTSLGCNESNQIQAELLWVKIGGKRVRDHLVLASANLNLISNIGQIADNG